MLSSTPFHIMDRYKIEGLISTVYEAQAKIEDLMQSSDLSKHDKVMLEINLAKASSLIINLENMLKAQFTKKP